MVIACVSDWPCNCFGFGFFDSHMKTALYQPFFKSKDHFLTLAASQALSPVSDSQWWLNKAPRMYSHGASLYLK